MLMQVSGLSKVYKGYRKEVGLRGSFKALFRREVILTPAVTDLNFSINSGEFVGLLGPNGAGKTTTLKMLCGLVQPTHGQAIAFGCYDTSKRNRDYLRRIGLVMGQRSQLNPDLPAIDSLRLAKAIYGLTEDKFTKRLNDCLQIFSIDNKLEVPVRKLSLGERMKMELILAIIHEPELLFLDEPTIGLDFNAAKQIRDFLIKANAELGITVILTSHYTKDIEELCRRVILINYGRMVYDGSLTGVDSRIQDQRSVQVSVRDTSYRNLVIQALNEINITTSIAETESDAIQFTSRRTQISQALDQILKNIPASSIHDIKITENGIDEIFAEIYRRPQSSNRS